MRIARIAPLSALLFAGCAASGPESSPPAEQAPAGLVQDGPFRMRVASSFSNRNPDGTLYVSFDVVVECADGRAFPTGRWFFEYPRLAEEPLLTAEQTAYQDDDYVGMPFGWSPKGYVAVKKIPADAPRIHRLVIDLPMLEVLEGVSEELTLVQGQEIQRRFGPEYISFIGQENSVSVFVMDQGEDVPPEPFFAAGGKPREHAWSLVDARGIPMNDQGGGGSTAISEFWYSAGHVGQPKGVKFPVTLHWRLPRRWRATMQRFVLEDLAVPPPEPEPK